MIVDQAGAHLKTCLPPKAGKMNRVKRPPLKRSFIGCRWQAALAAIFCLVLLAVPALADRRLEKDLDQDGKTDQILIYDDRGTILRVEADADQDGFAERVQFYEKGYPVRMERDTDQDRKMDCFDYFQGQDPARRIRQERFDPKGRMIQTALFNDQEQIRLMKKDTTGDQAFDTLYYFEKGVLVKSTRDTNANQRPDIFTWFEKDTPVRQEKDRDEDGIMEQVLIFDSQGQVAKQMKEPFGKGQYADISLFENTAITQRTQDTNQDSRVDVITRFDKGLPVVQEKDTNHDGKTDIITRFDNGVAAEREKDTNFDGTMDWFARFDAKGRILETREDTGFTGKIDRIREFRSGELAVIRTDKDRNQVFETLSLVEKGEVRQIRTDKNQDGTMDQDLYLGPGGIRERLERDTDFNGRPDLWQFYEKDTLARLEKDENGDGQKDLIVYYTKGAVKTRLVRDVDHDGYFETCQVYDHADWTLVATQDLNRDKSPDIRSCYQGKVLRVKEMDEDTDGRMDVKETYSPAGVLETLVEFHKDKGSTTWFYTPKETVDRAEADLNGDGRPEIWYLYAKGLVARVEEDTNLDGRPDLWEVYDESESLVRREKDLDYDGKPDYTDVNNDNDAARLDAADTATIAESPESGG